MNGSASSPLASALGLPVSSTHILVGAVLGIIGAIVFRVVFVAIGTGLLALGPYVEIIFALVVAYTAVMMLKSGGDDGAPPARQGGRGL